MARTKLKDQILPDYTRGEEIFHMVSHIVGGAIGVAILCLGVTIAVLHKNTAGIVTGVVYGCSVILLYTVSSVYHGLPVSPAKRVMRTVDHCTIYVMIAGCFTPLAGSAVAESNPRLAYGFLAFFWAMAILAIVFTAIDMTKYRKLSMVAYIGLGWSMMLIVRPIYQAIGPKGFMLLMAGGICYTVGAVIYGIGRARPYAHSVFHVLVVAGTVLHFFCIALYVL